MSAETQKRVAAEAAASLIEAGMTVGLGSGSTAALFVEALAARGLKIRGVATSTATAALARRLGIEVLDLDAVDHIDLTVDGADQIGPQLCLIKGGGAALLREKLVWEASRRCVASQWPNQVPSGAIATARAESGSARRMARGLRRYPRSGLRIFLRIMTVPIGACVCGVIARGLPLAIPRPGIANGLQSWATSRVSRG